MTYSERSVKDFIRDLGERKSSPGGGSSAAVEAALGAALHLMVIRYSDKEIELRVKRDLLTEQEKLLSEFLAAVDEDIKVFKALMEAYASGQDIPVRARKASVVPLGVARGCLRALELMGQTSRAFNKRLVTDLGGATCAFRSAFHAASFNVLVNLKSVEDKVYEKRCREELEVMAEKVEKLCGEIICLVEEELK